MPKVIDEAYSMFPGKRWLLVATLFFMIDQGTKWLILNNLHLNQIKPVFPGFQLTLAYNRGVAFSWFHNQPQWGAVFLILIIIGISGMIGWWMLKTPWRQKWEGLSLSLIFGGAMGNLLDRVWHGHVIDFIDVYYQPIHWYTFNVADAFITVGALMLLKEVFVRGESCQTQER